MPRNILCIIYMVTGKWRTHKYRHIAFLHICAWAFTDFTQWQWIRCALKKEKDHDSCESELVQTLWEWPTPTCYFLRGIHTITRKRFVKETDIIWMLAKKKLASLEVLVRRRGRVITILAGWQHEACCVLQSLLLSLLLNKLLLLARLCLLWDTYL